MKYQINRRFASYKTGQQMFQRITLLKVNELGFDGNRLCSNFSIADQRSMYACMVSKRGCSLWLFAKNLIHATDKTQMLMCFRIVKNEAVTLPFPWKKIGLQINSAI